MGEYRTPEEVAELIADIYEMSFSGKKPARYRISRADFRILTGRARIEDVFIDKVMMSCFQLGIVMNNLDDEFTFIKTNTMRKWRKVPSLLVKSLVKYEEVERLDVEDEE